MGDVDRRHTGATVEIDDLAAGMDAQVGVEVGQRLIHQEDARLADHGTGQRDALPLAAGHLAGLAIEQVVDLQRTRHFGDVALDRLAGAALAGHQVADEGQALAARQPAHGERHRDVLASGQVRIEGVGLEDHRNVAVGRRRPGHFLAADDDLAAVGMIEAGEDAQQRTLAAAGRADQRDEFARLDLEADALEDGVVTEGFGDAGKGERAHWAASRTTLWAAWG